MSRKADRLKRRHNGPGAATTAPSDPLETLVIAVREFERYRTAQLAVISAAGDALMLMVENRRRAGFTWQEIGDALGISRQAAAKRFAAADPRAVRRRAASR